MDYGICRQNRIEQFEQKRSPQINWLKKLNTVGVNLIIPTLLQPYFPVQLK